MSQIGEWVYSNPEEEEEKSIVPAVPKPKPVKAGEWEYHSSADEDFAKEEEGKAIIKDAEENKPGFFDTLGHALNQSRGITTKLPKDVVSDAASIAKRATVGDAEYDIPAIQETAEWKNMSGYKRAGSVFSSGGAVDEEFLNANPQFKENMRTDVNGNRMITKDGKPYAYFEQPGVLNWTDTREGAINAAVALIPGMGVAGTLGKVANAGRVARGVLGGAAEGYVQYKVEQHDLDEGIDKSNIALATIMAPVAEIIGATTKMVNSRQRRELTELGRRYAKTKGYDGLNDDAFLHMGMREKGMFQSENIKDEFIIAHDQYGIDGTLGEATGDAQMLGMEDALRNVGKKRINELDARKRQQVARVIDERFSDARAARSEVDTAEELMGNVKSNQMTEWGKAKTLQREKYDLLGAAGEVTTKSVKALDHRLSTVMDDFKMADELNEGAFPQSHAYMKALTKRLKSLSGKETMSMDELDSISSSMSNRVSLAEYDTPDHAALKRLQDEFKDYMQLEFKHTIKNDPKAFAALEALDESSASWRLYKETFKSQPGDRIGAIIEDIANKKADPELLVQSIIGADKIGATEMEISRMIKAGAGTGDTAKGAITEAIERRIWGSPKTSLAENTEQEAFIELRRLLHGDRKNLGNVIYPKGSPDRKDRELILKTMDQLRGRNIGMNQKAELFNTLYARLNAGGVRAVVSMDKVLGAPWRHWLESKAINPLKLKKGEFAGMTYPMAYAALEGFKD